MPQRRGIPNADHGEWQQDCSDCDLQNEVEGNQSKHLKMFKQWEVLES